MDIVHIPHFTWNKFSANPNINKMTDEKDIFLWFRQSWKFNVLYRMRFLSYRFIIYGYTFLSRQILQWKVPISKPISNKNMQNAHSEHFLEELDSRSHEFAVDTMYTPIHEHSNQ